MIETITTVSGFENLRTEWNALLESSNSNRFFLTWEWLHTWWKHLAENRKLAVVTVRSGEDLLAIAPFIRKPPGGLRLGPGRVLEFLGTGTVGSDYLDLIVRHDKQDETLQLLTGCMARTNSPLELARINKNSCASVELALRLRQSGWLVRDAGGIASPVISLAGHSWDSYLATLGSEHRYNFRRRLKALNKQFQFSFEPVRSEEERKIALNTLIHLHNLRWRGRGQSDAFCSTRLISFHDQVSALALERGWLRLFTLRLDGRAVASLYGFSYNRVFYFYQSGLDPAYSKYSVGLVAMGLAIKSAIDEGLEEYNLLCGAEEYKSHWAQQAHMLTKLELYPPGAGGALWKYSREVVSNSKKMARNVLPNWLAEKLSAAISRTERKANNGALAREDRYLRDPT